MNCFSDFIFRSWVWLLFVLIFFVLSVVGIFHHEIWLDEAQHFLIARDSHSLSELVYATRNEGHPLLWDVLLFMLTRFTSQVIYMQLIHVLISCITVFILAKSNLSLWEKILVVFGYFIFYEYNIISRNYGLSALLLFLLIHLYMKNKESVIKLAVIIFLLANTHLFSLLISVAFVFTYIVTNSRVLLKQPKIKILVSAMLILAGWSLSAYFIIPPNHYGYQFISYESSGFVSTDRIIKTISVCLKGIFYLPDYTVNGHTFWNSLYYLSLHLRTWQLYVLSAVSIAIPVMILRKCRFALLFFSSFLFIYAAVYFFLPLVNGIRYFGFFFLVFVVCYWMAKPQVPKAWRMVGLVIFTVQFVNGLFAYAMDLYYPFSESKEVSSYLKEMSVQNENVFILNRTLRPGISAYSCKKFFGVENGTPLSYCLWDKYLPDSLLKQKLDSALSSNSTSLIISNSGMEHLMDTTKLVTLRSFQNGIVKSDNATVYRFIR